MASEFAPSRLFSCADGVALVTGGATGIGRVCAEAIAAAGARVVIADLPGTDPVGVAAGLRRGQLPIVGAECDLLDPGWQSALVTEITEKLGVVDIVVSCAGVALDDDPETFAPLDRMFDLHVRSLQRLADLTLPIMADAGGGAFIAMSDVAGLRGSRSFGGYGVTQAAVVQLVRNLAVRWGDRSIRANAVSPGPIRTDPAHPRADDADAARLVARAPLGRFGTSAEIAGAVVWLASGSGAFVTGQNIVVDGGGLVAE